MRQSRLFALALTCSIFGHVLSVSLVTIVWPPRLFSWGYPAITFLGYAPSESSSLRGQITEKKIPQPTERSVIIDGEKELIPLPELTERPTPRFPADGAGTLTRRAGSPDMPRDLVYRPPPPKYPVLAGQAGKRFTLGLRFLIVPDGTVAVVENIRSTGYPELDEIGIGYIRRWRFLPLGGQDLAREQWAVITLEFRQP